MNDETPSFDELLRDPSQQFSDPELARKAAKQLMDSIEACRNAPSNTISVPPAAMSRRLSHHRWRFGAESAIGVPATPEDPADDN